MDTIQAETDYAAKVLDALSSAPSTIAAASIDEEKTHNAAGCMTTFLCGRLGRTGSQPETVERTTISWLGGIVNIRNAVRDHLWTNLRPTFIDRFRQHAGAKPSTYVMAAWLPTEWDVHVWAIPGWVVHDAMPLFSVGKTLDKRSVEILPGKNVFEKCANSPDLSPFYRSCRWSAEERTKLIEAFKIDKAARRRNRSGADDLVTDIDDDESGEKETPGFTTATVEFLKELPAHVMDGEWHEQNNGRYRTVLQGPAQSLVDALRGSYIERLSPEVAGGTRHLSILKKNDYGKGGYHDHYWFAFYDPAAGSKTKSVQLFFRMLGSEQKWRYGLSMGNYCDEYIERLLAAISRDRDVVAEYVEGAPADTQIRIAAGADERTFTPIEFAECLRQDNDSGTFGFQKDVTNIAVIREYELPTLPEHDDNIVEEVGRYLTWAWPFFLASMSGAWPKANITPQTGDSEAEVDEDVDEDAPATLADLSDATALPLSFLEQLEEALLAKHQAVLVGPPGTSKTYIAKQFARYFVCQRPGRPQGRLHELLMHASWSYEDFFEGLRPTTGKEGNLTFEHKKGFFLEWVEQLKEVDPSARNVLVLDEINRCDTAAVLGELLQLLEYRGTTVRLLSGRQFVLPKNLFILGTMNSADRSVGRMDLALRRRFLWLDLYPDVAALQKWLDRPGNNPAGFSANALSRCNEILSSRGIPKEQHIGHALFMIEEADSDWSTSGGQDVPLTERHLRQIVRFSVLPYVKELFVTQFGQVDGGVMQSIESQLLSCVAGARIETQYSEGTMT